MSWDFLELKRSMSTSGAAKTISVAARLDAPRDAHSILYSTLWGSRIYSSTFTDAASSLDWRGVNHARERDVGRHLVPSP